MFLRQIRGMAQVQYSENMHLCEIIDMNNTEEKNGLDSGNCPIVETTRASKWFPLSNSCY